jgi:hypothetical protein
MTTGNMTPAGEPVKRVIANIDPMADSAVSGVNLPIVDTEIAPPSWKSHDEYLAYWEARLEGTPEYRGWLAEHPGLTGRSAVKAWLDEDEAANDAESAADDPDYQAYLAKRSLPSSGSAWQAYFKEYCAKLDAEEAKQAARKAQRLADGEWWADPEAVIAWAESWTAGTSWVDQAMAPERARKAASRFAGRTPSEDANQPPLTYFDDHRTLSIMPRVPDGAALIVTGKRSSHKTGVVLKECVDAALKGVHILYIAYEGAHGIRTKRLPAICRQRGITLVH